MTHDLHTLVFPVDDDRLLPLYLRVDSGAAEVVGRNAVSIAADAVVSFAAYFNAFPAAYWAHATSLEAVRLTVAADGDATVRVWRSDAAGRATLVAERDVVDGVCSADIALGDARGGWLWFDVAARTALVVTHAAWTTEQQPLRTPLASIGITTFNKPDYCVRTLAAIGGDPALAPYLDVVRVVDQGDRAVSDEPGFGPAADRLGDTLVVVRQDNLGGSGGYARAMAHTLAEDRAEFVLLLDDDVEVETEAIRRAVVFGAYCANPTIVGGHMLDLHARTTVYAWAEVVEEHPFMWHARDAERMPLDLAAVDLRDEPLLHRRTDADYNGWWMCLIPIAALRAAGLALPAFIKWDDAEFSLRAREHGIQTISLPGVALWHISWVGKDDLIDWQAYFHARNRIVTALLHSGAPRGGSLLTHSRRVDVKHFMAMQYYPVALRHRALRAVLSGPDHLFGDLRSALPAARALAAEFGETRPVPELIPASVAPDWPDDESDQPSGMALPVLVVRQMVSQWLRRPRRPAPGSVEVAVPARRARWWRLADYDSAMVTMAGSGVRHLFVRDRAQYRRLDVESRRLHRRLRRRWKQLAADYRAADLFSPQAWDAAFAGTVHTDSVERA